MTTATDVQTLTDLITQSQHCVSLLKNYLSTELEILKSGKADQLIENSQSKESLMLELHELEKQRKLLTSANHITTKEQYHNWLDKLDNSGQLKKQWLELSEQIIACQNQNNTNGIISENMTTASRQALNILSGNTGPADSIYSANGKKTDQSSSLHNTTA